MDSDVKLEVTSSAPLSDLNSAVQHALLEQTVPLRRVSVACASCRKSHVCCDNKRPCGRCQSRNIDCVEIESRKRGPKKARKDGENSPNLNGNRSNSHPSDQNSPDNNSSPSQYHNNNSNGNSQSNGGGNNANRMLPPMTPPPPSPSFPTSPMFNSSFPSSPGSGFNFGTPNFSNNFKEGDYRRLPLPSSPWKSDGNEFYPLKSPSYNYLPSPQGSSDTNFLEEMMSTPGFGANIFESYPSDQSSPSIEEGKEVTEEEIVPPSFHLKDAKMIETIYEIFRRKKIQMFKNKEEWSRINKKIEDLRKFITKEQKRMLIKEFWNQLKELEHGASLVDIPVIIHERSGIIHFTNQAWLETMGHKIDLDNPNPLKGQFIFEQISAPTISAFGGSLPSFFLAAEVRSCKIEAEFKIAGTGEGGVEEKYVSGVSLTTIKRDIFGLPQLFVGHFIPHLLTKIPREVEKSQLVFVPPYDRQPPGTVAININPH